MSGAKWAMGAGAAVVGFAALPLLVSLSSTPTCGASPAAAAISVAAPASGAFTAENIAIAQAAESERIAARLPRRALVVILAAGWQESGVRNLTGGDRDSVGWLQQRANWGSVAERMNPATTSRKFYAHLRAVPGWAALPVTQAAQAVQISGYPDAYAQWEGKAEQLASVVAGPDAQAASASCGLMPAVRVATWNTYVGPRYAGQGPTAEARVTFGMLAIGRVADVIGTQEMSAVSRRKAAQAGLGDGWAMVGAWTAEPVFFRTSRFALMSEKVERVYRRGDPIEGPYQGDRWVVSAQLRDVATGQTVTIANTHELPPAGVAIDDPVRPRRTAVARHIYAAAVAAATAHPEGGALLTCDCNSDQDLGGLAAGAGLTRALDVFGNVAQATRSHTIDQVMWSGGTPTGQTVLPSYGSDHSARVVDFPDSTPASGGGPVPASFDHQGNPRTVEQAIAWLQRQTPGGASGEPVQGACERYMNLSYGLGGGYPTARSHWLSPGPKGHGAAPRGALIFIASSNPAQHVVLSIGNGQAISTDYENGHYAAGVIGVGPVDQIARAMGGPVLGWRVPNFHIDSEGGGD